MRHNVQFVTVRAAWSALLAASVSLLAGCASHWPAEVEANLARAGSNRAALEAVLRHYEQGDDPQKLQAAQFLIANMDGLGYAQMALYDEKKKEVAFEALDYPDARAAQVALDALEKQHGPLKVDRKHFDEDLRTMPSALLIENIDLAFQAWHQRPWSREMPFTTFCELILPYRGNREPLSSTRLACLARYADVPGRMKNPNDPQEAGRIIQQDVEQWIRFDELYYQHPTDQSFDEMRQREKGRCGDISTMIMYALRANAVPAACDYTPFWANRDNNHAWVVLLDQQGRGRAPLLAAGAKVYRKTFSKQPDTVLYQYPRGPKPPRYLDRMNYRDVTAEYIDTTDVTVRLTQPKPKGTQVAYICVFNSGEWQPVHWGTIQGDQVTFTKMGRHVAYLPAYYQDEKVVPAGPAFILTETGQVQELVGAGNERSKITLTATAPEKLYDPNETARPLVGLETGRQYELFVWDNGWVSQGTRLAGQTLTYEAVPTRRLYWVVPAQSHKLERIFTIEDGKQVWW